MAGQKSKKRTPGDASKRKPEGVHKAKDVRQAEIVLDTKKKKQTLVSIIVMGVLVLIGVAIYFGG